MLLLTSRFSLSFSALPNLSSHLPIRNSPGVYGQSLLSTCGMYRSPFHSTVTQDTSVVFSHSVQSPWEKLVRTTCTGPLSKWRSVASARFIDLRRSCSYCSWVLLGNFAVSITATRGPGSYLYRLNGGVDGSQFGSNWARTNWSSIMEGAPHQAFNRHRLQKLAISLRYSIIIPCRRADCFSLELGLALW